MVVYLMIMFGITACLCFLYTFLVKAVDEDNTKSEDEKIYLSCEKPTAEKYKAKLIKLYQEIRCSGEDGDYIVFRSYSLELFNFKRVVESHFEKTLYVYDGVGVHWSFIPTRSFGFTLSNNIRLYSGVRRFEHHPFDCFSLYSELDNYTLVKSNKFLWKEFVDTNETYKRDSWYKIDNGEYYTNFGIVYRFKDWVEVYSFEEWFINNKDNLKGGIELCKDPREEHWEHFLDLEIKAKKDRLQKCKEWVDTVLKKQQKYNDICLINEVATTPLIHDYETLKNFCNMSGEKVKFEEYEITNYLLIIRNTLTKV